MTMFYKPHILEAYRPSAVTYDEYGRVNEDEEESGKWERLCRCRCDDLQLSELVSEDGHAFVARHHIVCEGKGTDVKGGDRIRVLCEDGSLRAEGVITNMRKTNYYDYTEIWV